MQAYGAGSRNCGLCIEEELNINNYSEMEGKKKAVENAESALKK